MDMNIIQSAATEVLVNLSLAVISLAGAYAVYYIRLGASKLKAQTAQIEDESARKVLDNALADVENLATKSVGAMEQTTAKALRDAVKSGAANREDLLALGKQVFNEVKAAIAPEAQKVITDNLGSFDDYLTKCIEDAVLKVKQSDPFITLPEGVLLEGNTVTEEAAPSSKEQGGAHMDVAQITTVIGAAASLLCTLVVGALTFFIKKTLATLEEADKRNAAQIAEAKKEAAEKIAKVEEKLNDLKADLPLVYVTREDYIRVMNRVEDKLDQILYGKGKGKEE